LASLGRVVAGRLLHLDYLERQQKLTEREIPIVVLERVKAS
jgi:hypothetical protein